VSRVSVPLSERLRQQQRGRQAQRGWEVTLVNDEMLMQMESFPGVFIASTNLMEGLDQAALRRFDLKMKFDYLKADHAAELLRRYCADLALPAPCAEVLGRITRLTALTPGRFRRRHSATPFSPLRRSRRAGECPRVRVCTQARKQARDWVLLMEGRFRKAFLTPLHGRRRR